MEKQEVKDLILSSVIIKVEPTSREMEEIFKWEDNRLNNFKRRDIIQDILKEISRKEAFTSYTAPTFTEGNGYGVKYYLMKEEGQAYLAEVGSVYNKVYQLM